MKRTYNLTKEDKKKFITSAWDGDTTIYTVYENEEEYNKEKNRLKAIEEEFKKAKEEYYKYLESTDN